MEYPFNCYYSQVYSEIQWYYLLGSHLWVKYICLEISSIQLKYLLPYNCKLFVLRIVTSNFNCLLRIIIISYLKPYNCVQIICIKNNYLKQ